MKILAYIVLVLIACGSAGYLLRWQIVEQLLILIKPTDSFEQLGTPAAPDYRERKNWAVYPAKGDEDLYRADVLFSSNDVLRQRFLESTAGVGLRRRNVAQRDFCESVECL
jgi:uncharacterized protein YxeA